MVVEEKQLNEVVGVIEEVCSTGKIGDGKIFISNIEEVIRLRTRERGITAL